MCKNLGWIWQIETVQCSTSSQPPGPEARHQAVPPSQMARKYSKDQSQGLPGSAISDVRRGWRMKNLLPGGLGIGQYSISWGPGHGHRLFSKFTGVGCGGTGRMLALSRIRPGIQAQTRPRSSARIGLCPETGYSGTARYGKDGPWI